LLTNLDIGYQFTDNLKLSVGAQNLFNRFPNQLNSTLLQHLNVYGGQLGDPTAVEHYPFFSPFGIDGGFYYVKASYKF
jgi:iron complex outermembrane receptor protein